MRSFPIRKSFALLVCLIFILASSHSLSGAEAGSPGSGATLSLSDLAVPEESGKIQERFKGTSTRTILQIQDVHAHAIAQQNIASLLERFRTVFDIKTAALEGAWSTTSLPKSHTIATSREKQLLSMTLLEDDLISGPVYAAIMSSAPITLVGVEDESLYEKNRSLFLTHLPQTAAITSKLQSYGASLQALQKIAWSPDLLTFGNAFASFQESSDLTQFLPLLLKHADALKIPLSNFSQVLLLRDIMALEKSFTKERLDQEVNQVIKKYKNTPWTLEELIRGGKIRQEEIGLYPEIKKLTRLYKLRDEISLRDLTDQIATLTKLVLEKLVRVPGDLALWEKAKRFYLAKKILLLEAGPADLRTYESEKSLLETELAANGLTEALTLSLDFYNTVKERDQVFFDKIMNDPSLAGNIAIVTGGFHTDGLSEKFRDARISYITIAPDLGDTAANKNLYNARMMATESGMREKSGPNTSSGIQHPASPGHATSSSSIPHPTSSAESDTLSELRDSIAWTDIRYPKAYEVLVQVHDVRKAKAAFLGEVIPVSRNDRIEHLSRAKRTTPSRSSGTSLDAALIRIDEFAKKPRAEQLQSVQQWLAQGPQQREKAMLVSTVSILIRMMSQDPQVQKVLERAIAERDLIVLAQDIALEDTPLSLRGVERFDAKDITGMIANTPRFQRLAKKHPFAIMKEKYRDAAFVVLPEKATSLLLYRIITLNPDLYRAAKDPAFLALLEDLVSEILTQELSGKAA